jgi:hypothetical protein
VPTTHDEESVSDVIVLREAPSEADVVAPLDARRQPRFTARNGGGCRRRGAQLRKRVTRTPGAPPGNPLFCQEGTPTPRGLFTRRFLPGPKGWQRDG